jgi:hypothetical protein
LKGTYLLDRDSVAELQYTIDWKGKEVDYEEENGSELCGHFTRKH